MGRIASYVNWFATVTVFLQVWEFKVLFGLVGPFCFKRDLEGEIQTVDEFSSCGERLQMWS